MKFTKMHGLGNDFIVLEDMDNRIEDYTSTAREMCDRHFGIGADGILVVKVSQSADSKMLIYNSDGSQAEMCGNGIRCFAKYLYDNHIVYKENMEIETLDGIKKISLLTNNNSVSGAVVNMGKPDFNPKSIPARFEGDMVMNTIIDVEGKMYSITSLLMGVPHTVLFVDEIDIKNIGIVGESIGESSYFPNMTNVNFVKVIGHNEFFVRTWERGAGLTLACGTGACASLVACAVNGKTEKKALAHLAGGDLTIEWDKDGSVYMSGPAETVFTGMYK